MEVTDAVAKDITSVGFSVIEDVFDVHAVRRLRAVLEECLDEDLRCRSSQHVDHNMVHNLMARRIEFALLMENKVLQDVFCGLLGHGCIIYAYTSSSLPPKDGNYSSRIHVDCPRVIPGYVTNVGAIVALDEFTNENGATWFLPGSFAQNDAVSSEEFLSRAVRVYPKAGDVVFFNARTWHMGGLNQTNQTRHALTMNVCRSYMRQRFDYPRLVPKTIVDQLSEVGRRFLGFNVRMPTSLDEYYLPPSERLYKAGQE